VKFVPFLETNENGKRDPNLEPVIGLQIEINCANKQANPKEGTTVIKKIDRIFTVFLSPIYFKIDIIKSPSKIKSIPSKVHIAVSVLLIFVVILLNSLDGNVVSNLFKFATFTYGPLLGLVAFGILTNYKIKDKYAWIVGLLSISLTYVNHHFT
jgi:hypothetical protein